MSQLNARPDGFIRCSAADKDRFDKVSDRSGGLSHRRLVAALLNAWDGLSIDQQVEAIRATSEPAEQPA